MTPQGAEGLRLLVNQQITRAEQDPRRLLLFALDRHEPQGRALRRLADRLFWS